MHAAVGGGGDVTHEQPGVSITRGSLWKIPRKHRPDMDNPLVHASSGRREQHSPLQCRRTDGAFRSAAAVSSARWPPRVRVSRWLSQERVCDCLALWGESPVWSGGWRTGLRWLQTAGVAGDLRLCMHLRNAGIPSDEPRSPECQEGVEGGGCGRSLERGLVCANLADASQWLDWVDERWCGWPWCGAGSAMHFAAQEC